ncbi:MAG: hypothetical protein NTX91_00125, partial [candidate division SR1 bacterium]|nr:hypothetical protein [candidate division SR1 bacterium]
MVDKLQLASKPLGATKMFTRILITAGAIVFFLQPGFSKNSEKVKAAIKQTLEQYDAHRYTVKEADEIHTTTYTDFSTFHQKNLDGGGDTGTNALDFAVKNVDLYYPGMHQHLDSLINHLRDQEQKDTVNFLFQEHIFKNISDPKKQVAAVIYAMENMVFKGIGITKKFNKEHGKEYD